MPYDRLADLPSAVKKLSTKKQKQWKSVFNSCFDKHGEDSKCFRMAWGVVKKNLSDQRIETILKNIKCDSCQLSKDAVASLLQFVGKDPRLNQMPPSPQQVQEMQESEFCECPVCGASIDRKGRYCLDLTCLVCGTPVMVASGMDEMVALLHDFNYSVLEKEFGEPYQYSQVSFNNRNMTDPKIHTQVMQNLANLIKHYMQGIISKPTYWNVRRAKQAMDLFVLVASKSPYKCVQNVLKHAKWKKAVKDVQNMFNNLNSVKVKRPNKEKCEAVIQDIEEALTAVLT